MENKIRRVKLEILSEYLALMSIERYLHYSIEVKDNTTFLMQLKAKLDIVEKDY